MDPTHGRAKAGRPARTYIQQLCEDTGCCPEDLPRVMDDREEWRERVRDIRATSTTWWGWWKLREDFLKISLLEILNSLAIACWFLAIFSILILISLKIFTMILDVRIFTKFKKKIDAVVGKYLHIRGGTFLWFKTLYLDWFIWDGQKLLHSNFWGWSHIFSSHLEPLQQNIMIWYGNDSNCQCFIYGKRNVKYPFIS